MKGFVTTLAALQAALTTVVAASGTRGSASPSSSPTPAAAAGDDSAGLLAGSAQPLVIGAVCLTAAVVSGVGAYLAFRMHRMRTTAAKSIGGKADDGDLPFDAPEDAASPADKMMAWERNDDPSLWLAGDTAAVERWTSASPPGKSPFEAAAGHASPQIVSLSRVAESYIAACRINGTPLEGSLQDFTQAVRNSPSITSGTVRCTTPQLAFQAHTPQLGRSSTATTRCGRVRLTL